MSVDTFYRVTVWLPMVPPGLAVLLTHGLGLRPETGRSVIQLLLMMFLYGGLPYTLLALWATFWIGGRRESEIVRMVWRAPLLMVAAMGVLAALVFARSGELTMSIAFFGAGAFVSLVIGYVVVGLTIGLRELLARTGLLPPSPYLRRLGGAPS